MKTRTKIEILVVVAITAILLYFLSVKEQPARIIETKTTLDNARIDSVKEVMQHQIDSLKDKQADRKTKIIYRTKVIDSLRVIADTSCYPIIAAFDKKIIEYDSLVVDMSRENVLLTNKLYQTELQRTNDSLILADFSRKYNHLDSLYVRQTKRLRNSTIIHYVIHAILGGVAMCK